MVRLLIEQGANVRARDTQHRATSAGWADYVGQMAVRDLILTGPIDIFDAIDFD